MLDPGAGYKPGGNQPAKQGPRTISPVYPQSPQQREINWAGAYQPPIDPVQRTQVVAGQGGLQQDLANAWLAQIMAKNKRQIEIPTPSQFKTRRMAVPQSALSMLLQQQFGQKIGATQQPGGLMGLLASLGV